jgi:fructose-1,6-bisphosphatase I
MPAKIGMTLDEFIILKEKDYPNATGGLSKLMRDIGLSAKFINREVRNAGLNDVLGAAGSENIQGEQVQKLDLVANDLLIKCLRNGGACAGIASEENEDYVVFEDDQCKNAKYVVLFDPLDGSSNIDICAPIGTIFSIYKRVNQDHIDINDFTQKGTNVVGAGYIIYGSSTMMVYSTGNGVYGFTLDSSIGEFCLSHIDIKTPKINNIYSINQGSVKKSDKNIQDYAAWCLEIDKPSNRPYSLRYIGSMVADFHRNLIKGGVFIYYSTSDAPGGKLRLLYECIPMAYIQEQAGGKASTGSQRILEVNSTELHQRTPIIIGSADMVDKVLSF